MSENDSIKLEQAKILYKQSSILFVSTLIVVCIVLFFFKDHPQYHLMIIWAAIVFILTSSRVVLVKKFHAQREIDDPNWWLNTFTFSTFLSGVTWGGILIAILQPSLSQNIVILTVILTGMTAGATVPLSSYKPAFISFVLPSILPFAFYLIGQKDAAQSLTGMMLVIYTIAMVAFSLLVNRNIIDSIRLRFENIDLLDEAKKQRALAEKANIDKSRFLAATSHDLRQPLHALDLYLGALEIQLKEQDHIELLQKASTSSRTLSELLNTLMDMSKLDSGVVKIQEKLCSLRQLITAVCSEFEQQAQDKNIAIELKINEAMVRTDPVLLGRMLRNLISNAINHNDNCKLDISTRLNTEQVTILIEDSGQGIAETELDNIFSEFYQLNNPERDRSKGLGLGLAIVKRLSHLLDIAVDVTSELNKGTAFSLIMPIVDEKPVELDVHEPSENKDLTGLFIIVIDDEAAVRDAIRSLLRAWGCEVLLAGSESDLLQQLKQDSYPAPDLIISDYRLRDNKTGIESVEMVRNYFSLALPALIITGDSSSLIVSEINQKQYGLLLKPVDSQRLLDEITQKIS